jgi:hypothetical protein
MKRIFVSIFFWMLAVLLVGQMLIGCTQDTASRSTGIYMLLDTSGTYTGELKKAQSIINYLLGTLSPGDSLAVARIDSASFSEKDIIAKVTFDSRPSVSNKQKLRFRDDIDDFTKKVKSSRYTDISGGVLQGIEFLNETRSGKKYMLVFSDLKEELPKGVVRNLPFDLDGFTVIAINVTKLRGDNVNPREYMDRMEFWREKVEKGGGQWKIVNDLERLDRIFER